MSQGLTIAESQTNITSSINLFQMMLLKLESILSVFEFFLNHKQGNKG